MGFVQSHEIVWVCQIRKPMGRVVDLTVKWQVNVENDNVGVLYLENIKLVDGELNGMGLSAVRYVRSMKRFINAEAQTYFGEEMRKGERN